MGLEPWISDGTASGTRRIADFHKGLADSAPGQFVNAGNEIFFVADDCTHGRELFALLMRDVEATHLERYGRGCPGTDGKVPRLTTSGLPRLGNSSRCQLYSEERLGTERPEEDAARTPDG